MSAALPAMIDAAQARKRSQIRPLPRRCIPQMSAHYAKVAAKPVNSGA
jgi:hypothetical protein